MSDKLNLIETISKEEKWSTFSRLLGTSGSNSWFSSDGDFTVFAPTNDAFAKIPDAKMNELLNEPNQVTLGKLISYHILPGKIMSTSFPADGTMRSVTGEDLTFTDTNGLKVNGAIIQARNILATNGVVHQVDTVLAPTPVAAVAGAGVLIDVNETRVAKGATPVETPAARPAIAHRESAIL